MSTTGSTVPEEWRDLACDFWTTWGRCTAAATHGVFAAEAPSPLAARCAEHIEAQRAATAQEYPEYTLEVRSLV